MSKHYAWLINGSGYEIIAKDDKSESILFIAYGRQECEINGEAFLCKDVDEFWELVEFFEGETFEW